MDNRCMTFRASIGMTSCLSAFLLTSGVALAQDTTPPTVVLTSPSPGARVSGTVAVSATATDNVGVFGVQFQLDGVNLRSEDNSNPYSRNWDTTLTSDGPHTLTAVARDAAGNRTTSRAVAITVANNVTTPDTTPPTVAITSPSAGSTVTGTITVGANASDNVRVAGVQFFLDGGALGAEDVAAPFAISWNSTTVSEGSHTLTAQARDAAGNRTTSSAVTFNVRNDTTPPTVAITSPSAGSTVTGTITISATASDNMGVAGVQFFLDGAALGAEDVASPFDISWNSATVGNGPHALTARARDAAGSAATSAVVTVTVFNDTAPPTVAITAPSAGSTVAGTINISVTASDNVGVAGVQFFLDGAVLGAEDVASPFEISWNTTTVGDGPHALTARARDTVGNAATSAVVTITVRNDTTPPTIAITSPSSGASVSANIAVNAIASDNVGVAGVQFFLDGAPLGTEDTTAPFIITWNTTVASNGTHALTAQARDVGGNIATSTPVTVTVSNDTAPPTVVIESPLSGATVFSTVAVRALASDNVGVVGVQFFVDGAILGLEDVSAPYAVAWDTGTFANGPHTLTAVARDATGNVAASLPVTVTLSNDTTPPTIAIGSPLPGATLSGDVIVSATASDNVGIMHVQFLLDGAPLGGEDVFAPYTATWNTSIFKNGSYTLAARAHDAAGNVATSSPVTVTVSNAAPPLACGSPLAAFPGTTIFNNTVRAQLWFANNTWWGAFSDGATGIYFYRLSGGSFVKGALIDPAFGPGKPDALWNGRELFILVFKSGVLASLYKYSFSGGSFALLPGFPVNLPLSGLANAIALDQDSTGKLWATYTSGTNVRVIWSTSPDHLIWNTTGVVLEDNIFDKLTEAATIVHFGGNKIGVAWSNQLFAEYAFRFHRDGDPENLWSQRELIDCCSPAGSVADDHLSLRAAPDGRLFVAAKDSIGTGYVHLFVRSTTGTWSRRIPVTSNPADQPTRPSLVLDVQNNHAYVLYHNSTDGLMYVARAAMDAPEFTRCAFRAGGSNPTATKQSVNATTGLIAAASAQGLIFPGSIALGSAPAAFAASQAEFAASAEPAPRVDLGRRGVAENAAARLPASLKEIPAADFEVIWEGRMSTSRAPTGNSQWRWLRQQGVNTIVHLDAVMMDFAQFGFESFFWAPLRTGQPPSNEKPDYVAERFLRFIQLSENQPAHLSGGAADARAVMVALALYAIEGLSVEDAISEARRLTGAAELSSEQMTWLLSWAENHAPGSHRLSVGAGQREMK